MRTACLGFLFLSVSTAIPDPSLPAAIRDEASLEIAVVESAGQVDVGRPFKVEVRNLTDKPVTIYSPKSAEGFRALSLLFTHKMTKQECIASHIELVPESEQNQRNPNKLRKPELRAAQLDCRSKTLEIAAKGIFHFYVFLQETIESERPDVGSIESWDLRVLYRPAANTEGVWSGIAKSKPVQGRLICSKLDDPRTAIKLSETATLKLLETDPKWLNSLGALQLLQLGIANDRPTIVRWAIQHKASPFHQANAETTDGFENCPAAKIASVEVLKVVWDELPTRHDDLFFTICEVARRGLSNPFSIESGSYEKHIAAMLDWGAKPSLFSAIYMGDIELVKSMLSTSQQLPESKRKPQNFGFQSPLVWAVACGEAEIAAWLIDRFTINVASDFRINGPLLAYAQQNAAMTELLCKHHAPLTDTFPSGGYAGSFTWQVDPTAIDFAAAFGTPEVMATLLEYGGDLEYSASEMHPLAIAAHEKNWPVLMCLIKHPKFLLINETSRASIMIDVAYEISNTNTRRLQLQEGSLTAFAMVEANGALHNHIQEKIQELTTYKGDPRDLGRDSAVWLMRLALEQHRLELVTQLLDAGYETHVGPAEFYTATRSENHAALKVLADRCSFDFDVCKDQLLRVAAGRGDFVTTEWLLGKDANPTNTDSNGQNALDAATKNPAAVTTAEVERLIASRIKTQDGRESD